MTAYILGALSIGVFVAAKKIPDSAFEWTSVFALEKKPSEMQDDLFNKWHGVASKTLKKAGQLAVNPTVVVEEETPAEEDPEVLDAPENNEDEEQ